MLAARNTPRALARCARPAAASAARQTLLSRASLTAGVARTAPRLAAPAFSRSFHASPLTLGYWHVAAGLTKLCPADEIVKVPSMAESITEGTLKQWLKQKGDYVEADEEVATIETDKIDVAVNAPKAGVLTELLANEEDTVAVGQDLFKLDPNGKAEGGAKKEEAPKEEPKQEEPKKEEPKKDESKPEPKKEEAIPEAKSEYRKPDSAQPAPKAPEPSKKEEGKTAPQSPAAAAPKGSRNETRVKMSRMRARIAERLKEAQNTAASLTTFNEIDMSALMAFRAKYKEQVLKDHGVKLGFMSAFVKASTIALREFPAVNASIEGTGTSAEIVYRDYADVSVAVSTPKGLVTPVLRNAEQYNFVEIEREIANLGKKARDGKLTLEDMNGGTFTISNGGVFGSLYGTPILNPPQCAVLGMHSIVDRVVARDGQAVIRPVMKILHHRVIDGREAVSFLVLIKKLIEDPALLNLYN
ncbi:2-oxoglutarate dehydrogenase E2 component (dihydrolipoamide succinyltransferase) [Rhodotorula toruloides NP11]|uniref:dihydrolipoyllysine-residue succinyltransferase n=1 Tax=Rhodotorula toruloides (strain NP11) TaxID=1130832 RepID=M7WKF8_RHOT1|nr:2-oxoglutarate dehydrogenase E2 component (dihydrolipoamide succinyltransferase) [Rhodotorula toruloides NP11]EMS20982.1 2-oxoglutarate dehydrogenase E2 component (dihydrolipoamide succinyltransferase) [Rhodotorula toruloides NP11]